MAVSSLPIGRDQFNIAVICALGSESNAVEGIFDEVWPRPTGLGKSNNDPNTYTLGRIGYWNVVLAYLPHKGKVSSASTSAMLLASFPQIELVIVVGVCGGVPHPQSHRDDEIILGDVIISTEVVQFDFGRLHEGGFEQKRTVADSLGRAPSELRTFIKYLSGYIGRNRLREDTGAYLMELLEKPGFHSSRYPGVEADRLFPVNYRHVHRAAGTCGGVCSEAEGRVCETAIGASCRELGCDEGKLLRRPRLRRLLEADDPKLGLCEGIISPDLRILFGPIASGDQVIRSATHRDRIAESHGVIAFEMEGAGVWDNRSTVVIKSVSDYADSHKDKDWQPYSAAVAAACMKAFLKQFADVDPNAKLEPPRRQTFEIEAASSKAHLTRLLALFAIFLLPMSSMLLVWAGRWETPETPPLEPVNRGLDTTRPIFGILGKTGVGKSSFIDLLGGRNRSGYPPEVCHGLESCMTVYLLLGFAL
ncbi:nucleoside phosphorylase domain-containing protein [Aspergillus lucknowensis]|uniref:Nucleoside phosphorylase domain-containing protein n=1 Tax=Aspergillus lucknowensis TaxID=176173 RepID=A0ABR4LHW8_9EURO